MAEEQQQRPKKDDHQVDDFKVGDHVAWSYGTGKAKGHIMEMLTEDRKLGSRTFKATPEEPKFLLKIDKTGKEAIRKAETLEKIVEETNVGKKEDKQVKE